MNRHFNRVAGALLICLALLPHPGCGNGKNGPDRSGEPAAAKYHCPMHPTYIKDVPGDCPICGMRLVPITQAGGAENAGTVPGRMAIVVPEKTRQLIGVTFSEVARRPLNQTLHTVGTVIHDETKLVRVAPRFSGWVRSIQVNYTGQPVRQGEPLFTVYSPELFAAANDYLITVTNARSLTNSPTQRESADSLVASARGRLELLGLDRREIEAMRATGHALEEIQIRAPISGHVTRKNVVTGQAFVTGETLYEIADLTDLWVRALVFEYEFLSIKVGQPARIVFPYLTNRAFESRVAFIGPHIDPQTRRAEIRLNLSNPEHLIRPEMWANVEIETHASERLAVPASAVIDTGVRFIAFVQGERDHLEPREVKLGIRTDDYYEVLEGLRPGERVVTRALFLIDSESQLKAAIAGMTGDSEKTK